MIKLTEKDELQALLNKFHEGARDTDLVLRLGAIYWSRKEFAEASKFFKLAVEEDPKNESYSRFLFHALWNSDQEDGAFEEAKRFLIETGTNPYKEIIDELNQQNYGEDDQEVNREDYDMIATAEYRCRKSQQFERKAINSQSLNSTMLSLKGVLEQSIRSGEVRGDGIEEVNITPKETERLEGLFKSGSRELSLLLLLGAQSWIDDDLDTALTYFREAVAANPENELASLALFHVLWERKEIVEAFREVQRFLETTDNFLFEDIIREML